MKTPTTRAALLFAAAAMSLLPGITTAHAQTNAITFTGGNKSSAAANSTRGFAFSVSTPVTVVALSFYDAGLDGLETAHEVGIWDNAGTLLTSATVPSGTAAPLLGDFRTVAITSLVLPVGTGYTVGGLFSIITEVDTQSFGWTSGVTASGIIFDEGRFIDNSTATLTRPTATSPFITKGLTGGSFVTSSAAVVPEAGAGYLALLGVPALGFVIRRRVN